MDASMSTLAIPSNALQWWRHGQQCMPAISTIPTRGGMDIPSYGIYWARNNLRSSESSQLYSCNPDPDLGNSDLG